MKIIETKVFSFEELSKEVKQKVLEKYYDISVSDQWWDLTYDDAKEIGFHIQGFDLDRGSYVKGKLLGTAESTAELIKENHGDTCATYKTAHEFLIELSALKDLAAKEERDLDGEIEDLESDFLDKLCTCYLKILRDEYEYLTSEESIIETFEANEYTFTAEGKMFNS